MTKKRKGAATLNMPRTVDSKDQSYFRAINCEIGACLTDHLYSSEPWVGHVSFQLPLGTTVSSADLALSRGAPS